MTGRANGFLGERGAQRVLHDVCCTNAKWSRRFLPGQTPRRATAAEPRARKFLPLVTRKPEDASVSAESQMSLFKTNLRDDPGRAGTRPPPRKPVPLAGLEDLRSFHESDPVRRVGRRVHTSPVSVNGLQGSGRGGANPAARRVQRARGPARPPPGRPRTGRAAPAPSPGNPHPGLARRDPRGAPAGGAGSPSGQAPP